ncbi:SDR family oxidoreductase [Deinococcus rubellus]|uniref:SDR family oxidoreductase n=1 Tax=Deinococcus rubellus TaxID=1889240 RepID=UPI003CD06CA2
MIYSCQRRLDPRADQPTPSGLLRLEGWADQPDLTTGRGLRSPAGARQCGLSWFHRHRHGRRARARLFPDQQAAARQPLGRQAQAVDVARVVVFPASGAASFMTGSVVTVDGGCPATFSHGA